MVEQRKAQKKNPTSLTENLKKNGEKPTCYSHTLFDRQQEAETMRHKFKCQLGFGMKVQTERVSCSPDLFSSQQCSR